LFTREYEFEEKEEATFRWWKWKYANNFTIQDVFGGNALQLYDGV